MILVPVEGAPKVVAPSFNCDFDLGDDIPEPLPSQAFFMGIFGTAGSGKTSSLVSMLTARRPNRVYRGVFTNVFFIMPPNSRSSLVCSLFDDHPPEKVYDELNPEVLEHIFGIVNQDSKDGFSSLICIDDCSVDLKNKGVEKLLRKIVNNRRHLKTSIIILSQTYSSIPLSVRKTFSHFIMFKNPNKKEFQSVFDELIHKSKDEAEEIIQVIFESPRDFLYGVCSTGKLYRNFTMCLE